jgi:putative phosphoribosyl transferase
VKLHRTEIGLPAGEVWLDGILTEPRRPPGLVVVTERIGRRLDDTRGAVIASVLQEVGFATLQVGLLSFEEGQRAPGTWNQVPTLCARISAVASWIRHQPTLKQLPIGMVARDVAVAAMIRVAASADAPFRALVGRDGRPDLAGLEPLRNLVIPLLLVVGARDDEALPANRQAFGQLDGPRKLAIIPGATDGFKEPGKLDEAMQHMIAWFVRWLATGRS